MSRRTGKSLRDSNKSLQVGLLAAKMGARGEYRTCLGTFRLVSCADLHLRPDMTARCRYLPRFHRVARAVLSALCLVGLPAACSREQNRGGNILYERNQRGLAGATTLTPEGLVLPIEPPLAVANTVQYITLEVAQAGLWRRNNNGGSGALFSADGREIVLSVELESVSGKRYPLNTVSFGKTLMFSYLATAVAPGDADLPRGERFNRLHLRASRPQLVDKVGWVDITNK